MAVGVLVFCSCFFVLSVLIYAIIYLLSIIQRHPADLSLSRSVCGILINVLHRSQGKLPLKWGGAKKDDCGRMILSPEQKRSLSSLCQEWRVDDGNFKHYCRLCECDNSEPPCYIETAFLKLFIKIISSPDFPVSPLALIHVRQTVTVYSAMQFHCQPRLRLEVHVDQIHEVSKGVEVDLATTAYYLPGQVLVWQGLTTLLSRNSKTQTRSWHGVTQEPGSSNTFKTSQCFQVPEDTGWKYAQLTGDYNPYHLNPLLSRLVGYKRHMAHGMWTLARALSVILEDDAVKMSPHYPLQVSVQFKRPLFMPNTASVQYKLSCSAGNQCSKVISFQVTSQDQKSLNLIGTVIFNAANIHSKQ